MSLRRSSSSASPLPPKSERETLLTTVCGYPLQTIYRGQAALLGAPVYAVDHCGWANTRRRLSSLALGAISLYRRSP